MNLETCKEVSMKTAKTTMKLFATAIALVTAVAIWSAWGARQAQAVQDSEEVLSSIGITSGQTARLNVLNSGEERGIVIDWRFFDGQGRVLAQSPERQLIPPGQMRSFDLNADEVNATRDRFGRVQVIAIIRALGGPDTKEKKNLHTSLEIFDNATGKTTVFVPPALIKGFN